MADSVDSAGLVLVGGRQNTRHWLMRFPPAFLDDIRARVPISRRGRAQGHVGQAEIQSRPRRLLGLLPLPRREDAVLPRREPQGPLSLLRLRRVGRSFHLPGRAGGAELSRGRGAACRRGRHPASRARSRIRRSARRSAPACTRWWRRRRNSSRRRCRAPDGGKARAYLRERGLVAGNAEALPHRLCAGVAATR